MAQLAQLAEEAGWDGIHLEDYIVYQGQADTPTYDPWVTLAAMAVATQRVRLGTSVTPVPRRRPWKLASEAVTLDHLSGGRLILGVGSGDLQDPGFGAVSEPTEAKARAGRLDEALAIIDALWRGGSRDPSGSLLPADRSDHESGTSAAPADPDLGGR
jgi:alkanesulfonate monooxygenase SsuD/methylene tetrahydromethanopterin reductase-like flavin-dependent oxidoreductase (luciferase family)